MHSAIRWFGGKGHLTQHLLPLLPSHRVYVEPFGGAASLLHAKAPSAVEVYNDVNRGLVNFWRVIRDRAQFEEFCRRVALTPYSRHEWRECRETWMEQADLVEMAVRWYTVARQVQSGDFRIGGWSFARGDSEAGMAATVARWLAAVDKLPEIHRRWMRVQIECDNYPVILERYDSPETLFYCDPPYVPTTRPRSSTRYEHEMTEEDHGTLVRSLLALQGKVVLSGYDHPVYAPLMDAGWGKQIIRTQTQAVGRTRKTKDGAHDRTREEVVWMSPNCEVGQMRFL